MNKSADKPPLFHVSQFGPTTYSTTIKVDHADFSYSWPHQVMIIFISGSLVVVVGWQTVDKVPRHKDVTYKIPC